MPLFVTSKGTGDLFDLIKLSSHQVIFNVSCSPRNLPYFAKDAVLTVTI